MEKRFPKSLKFSLRKIYGWTVVFSLVMPLLFWLAASMASKGKLFGTWPSLLEQIFEHTAVYGWVGMFVIALVYIIYPEVIGKKWEKTDVKRLRLWVGVYAVGVLIYAIPALLYIADFSIDNAHYFTLTGTCLELVAWMMLMLRLFAKYRYIQNQIRFYHHLVLVGMIPFTLALFLNPIVSLNLIFTQTIVAPFDWLVSLRLLPLSGIALILLAILTRLAPEMLAWRPADEKKLRRVFFSLFLFSIILLSGYFLFHFSNYNFAGFLYLLGLFGVLLCVIALYAIFDFFHMRKALIENTEHVPFMYAALIWLLISLACFVYYALWEVRYGMNVSHFWADTFMAIFFLGFFSHAIFAIFIYVSNQTQSVKQHKGHFAFMIFSILSWAIILRSTIYPLMVFVAWPGEQIFLWFIYALMYLGIAFTTLDLIRGYRSFDRAQDKPFDRAPFDSAALRSGRSRARR